MERVPHGDVPFWEPQNRYDMNSSYPSPKCCDRRLQVHLRAVRIPFIGSLIDVGVYGYIRVQISSEVFIIISLCIQHPALQASFQTFLLGIYLVCHVHKAICLPSESYRHLTEQDNGRIH